MIILTMLIIVIMLLIWSGLASLGVRFSDTIGWLLFLAAIAVVFALYALISGWFKRFESEKASLRAAAFDTPQGVSEKFIRAAVSSFSRYTLTEP